LSPMNTKRNTTRKRRWWAALGAVALCGCGLIYTDVQSPYAYRTATPGDVKSASADEVVSGQACMHSVLFLVAWGDAGYAAATREPDVRYGSWPIVANSCKLLGLSAARRAVSRSSSVRKPYPLT